MLIYLLVKLLYMISSDAYLFACKIVTYAIIIPIYPFNYETLICDNIISWMLQILILSVLILGRESTLFFLVKSSVKK